MLEVSFSSQQFSQPPFLQIHPDFTQNDHRVFWEDPREVKGRRIQFEGTPFFLLATKVYDCQHGQDRNSAKKAKLEKSRKHKQVHLRFSGARILFS